MQIFHGEEVLQMNEQLETDVHVGGPQTGTHVTN